MRKILVIQNFFDLTGSIFFYEYKVFRLTRRFLYFHIIFANFEPEAWFRATGCYYAGSLCRTCIALYSIGIGIGIFYFSN